MENNVSKFKTGDRVRVLIDLPVGFGEHDTIPTTGATGVIVNSSVGSTSGASLNNELWYTISFDILDYFGYNLNQTIFHESELELETDTKSGINYPDEKELRKRRDDAMRKVLGF